MALPPPCSRTAQHGHQPRSAAVCNGQPLFLPFAQVPHQPSNALYCKEHPSLPPSPQVPHLIIDAVPLRLHRTRVRARHHAVAQVAGPQHAALLPERGGGQASSNSARLQREARRAHNQVPSMNASLLHLASSRCCNCACRLPGAVPWLCMLQQHNASAPGRSTWRLRCRRPRWPRLQGCSRRAKQLRL